MSRNCYLPYLLFFMFFSLSCRGNAQSIFDTKRDIYEVTNNIDLKGKTISLHSKSLLKFSSGTITNGTLVFTDNTLSGNVRFENCHFKGSLTNLHYNIIDFGADNHGKKDNAGLINEIIRLKTGNNQYGKKIFFPAGNYRIDSPIVILTNYNQPIDIYGIGPGSIITQYTDNTYILKVYERQNISNLSLKYKNFQGNSNNKAIAIACKRSLMSHFSDIFIEGCHTAIGFIFKEDWDSSIGENSSIVNNYYDNIWLWSYSGYFINTMDRVDGGDSGSVFNNIYVSSSKNPNGVPPLGALFFGTSTATFNQLNLENDSSSTKYSQIYCSPFASITISILHVEGQKKLSMPIISARNFSQVNIGLMQVEFCRFPKRHWAVLEAANNSYIGVESVTFRSLSDPPIIKLKDCYQNSTINVRNVINVEGYDFE